MNTIAETARPNARALSDPFRILADRRTYGSLLYLLLSFPLGLIYFILFAVGLSLGVGLLVLAIGGLILFLVVLAGWMLTLFERWSAIHLLGADVPPARPDDWPRDGWPWIRAVFTNPVTWKGLLFLGLKFPLGLASWVTTVVVLSVVGAFVAAPVSLALGHEFDILAWHIESYGEAAVLSLIGLALVLPTAYFVHALGAVWGRFSELMLGQR